MILADRIEREALADRTAVLMSGADVDLPSVFDRLRSFDEALAAPFPVADPLKEALGLVS